MATKAKKPPVPNVLRSDVKPILLHRIQSSQIHSAGYDAETQTLAMRFQNEWSDTATDEYRYSDFPLEKWSEFQSAPSKGVFHKQHIRDNPRHACVRVRDSLAAA